MGLRNKLLISSARLRNALFEIFLVWNPLDIYEQTLCGGTK